MSVVVIDLDHFKRINDTFGHAEGDRALALAAAALRDVVRETDAVGRLGGEEFVLVLPGVDAAAAREAAERARIALAEVADRRAASSRAPPASPAIPTTRTTPPGLLDGRRRRALRRQGHRPRPHLPLPPEPRLRPSPGEERDEIEALLRDPARDRARLPAGARARHRPRLGLRGARALPPSPARGPDEWFAQAHRVGLGAELEARRAARRARRPRPPRRHLPRGQREPAALLAPELVHAALPEDLVVIVVELTEHELFGAEDDARARAGRAARPRRAHRARRRRRRLRRACSS